MGANCCTQRAGGVNGDQTPFNQSGITPLDDSKFRQDLYDKYQFHRVDFSTFGGETEAAILVEKNSNKSHPILCQRFTMSGASGGNLLVSKGLEQQLETLKSVKGSLYTDFYKRENGIYYTRADFLG